MSLSDLEQISFFSISPPICEREGLRHIMKYYTIHLPVYKKLNTSCSDYPFCSLIAQSMLNQAMKSSQSMQNSTLNMHFSLCICRHIHMHIHTYGSGKQAAAPMLEMKCKYSK